MTFQAYLDAAKAKTGKTPEELKTAAEQAGVYNPDMTATQLVDWLKTEYGLGQGHSMAVWAVFKENGWTHAPKK
jgi:transposase